MKKHFKLLSLVTPILALPIACVSCGEQESSYNITINKDSYSGEIEILSQTLVHEEQHGGYLHHIKIIFSFTTPYDLYDVTYKNVGDTREGVAIGYTVDPLSENQAICWFPYHNVDGKVNEYITLHFRNL